MLEPIYQIFDYRRWRYPAIPGSLNFPANNAERVNDVLRPCDVIEIFWSVVSLLAVFVVDVMFSWAGAVKRFGNETMNRGGAWLASPLAKQTDVSVSGDAVVLDFENPGRRRHVERVAPKQEFLRGSYSPVIACFVSAASRWDWLPDFLRDNVLLRHGSLLVSGLCSEPRAGYSPFAARSFYHSNIHHANNHARK